MIKRCPSVKRVHCGKMKAPSEKSSIMTNRKEVDYELSNEPKMNSISLSLSPLAPKRGLKRKVTVFRIKVDLSWSLVDQCV